MRRRAGKLFNAVSAVLMLVMGGCGDSQTPTRNADSTRIETTPQGHQYGGHLRVGYAIEPTSLDAVLGRSGGDAYYWHQIYDQLVDASPDLSPRPIRLRRAFSSARLTREPRSSQQSLLAGAG